MNGSFKLNLDAGASFSRKLVPDLRRLAKPVEVPAWYVRVWRWLLEPVE